MMMERFKKIKLLNKLIIMYLSLVIIPFLLLGVFAIQLFKDSFEHQIDQNSNYLIHQVSEKIDNHLFETQRNIELFLMGEDIDRILNKDYSQHTLETRLQDKKKLEKHMKKFLSSRLELESIYIYRSDGEEFYVDENIRWESIRKKLLMNKINLKMQADLYGKQLFWEYMNKEIGLLTGVSMIYDSFGRQSKGLLIFNIQESYIRGLFEEIHTSKNSFFVLTDQGEIVSTNAKHENSIIQEIINQKYHADDNLHIVELSKTSFGNFYVSTSNLVSSNWVIYEVIPVKEMMSPSNLIMHYILIACIIIAFISILCLFFMSSYFLRPLKNMMKVMERVKNEDFSATVEEPKQMDEIGEFALVFNSMICKIRYLIKEVYEQNMLQQKAEFKLLQAQINPHFLYNTLDSINWLARINKVPEISDIVLALGQLMRISISNDKMNITIEEELGYVENYLTIQKMRYGDKLSYFIDLPQVLTEQEIPKLLLEPLVENAVVHGIEKKIGKGTIIIRVRELKSQLLVQIIDDGVGISAERIEELKELEYETKNENHTGVGYKNVARRIAMIYGEDYGVSIVSNNGNGTRVSVYLPISK